MRLTLRTMLAYLDNILEPNDAEVLGAKISDSEFASELVYRTLSSTRKANLNAPPLEGRGIGGDPNSVAEYLDNTLDETRIPGFEKVCLESDMFLSEVACCHNILSICIDQPVTVENEIRDRVLSLVEASLAKTEDLVGIEPQSKFALDTLIEPKPAGAPEYIKKKAHPIAGRWDSFLHKTLGDSADKFSIGTIAKESIEEKLAEEQINRVRLMINRRFGPDTWTDILEERRRRIEEHTKEVKKQKLSLWFFFSKRF